MKVILKTLRTIRNNWKKSVFASVCLFYGGKFVHSKYHENLYLREVCEEARRYGDAPLGTDGRLRHVTVIINPTANDGKCRAQFDKYCGPLLNLAGIKVGIISTEAEGQAKELMQIMDNTDAVLVAGGDGTVAEVVTGLLRREDRVAAVRRFPLALVPLGRTNGTAGGLLPSWTGGDAARAVTQATMALVRETLRPLDAMEVQAVETAAEVPGRPVYLLSHIWWGAHRDVHAKTHKYWYWGALKARAAYLLNAFRELTWQCRAELEYTDFCAGCSRCRRPAPKTGDPTAAAEKPAQGGRWWSRFIPQPRPQAKPPAEPEVDYSTIDNPGCGVWRHLPVTGAELRLCTSTSSSSDKQGLQLSLGPEAPGAFEFIGEGWRRIRGEAPTVARELTVGQVRLTPALEVRSAGLDIVPTPPEDSTAPITTTPGDISSPVAGSTNTQESSHPSDSESPTPVATSTTTQESSHPSESGSPTPVATSTSAQESSHPNDGGISSVTARDIADGIVIGKLDVTAVPDEPASTSAPKEKTAEDKDAVNTRWFSFDSEEFEVRPLLVKLMPEAVRVFAGNPPRPVTVPS